MKNFLNNMAAVIAAAILIPSSLAQAAPVKPVAHQKKEPTKQVVPQLKGATTTQAQPMEAPADTATAKQSSPQSPPIPIAPPKAKVPFPSGMKDAKGQDDTTWGEDEITFYPFKDSSPDSRYSKLTDRDYREVAEELGVEVAAIKAVVEIEAGKAHEGFYQPGKPIINFDLSMYRKFAPKHGVSLTKAGKQAPVIFASPNTKKYGSYQAAQYARLDAARAINAESAYESAFWGMFQIGGFNWRLCGCASADEFVEKMSRSERDQLELFAQLITRCGMVDALRQKQWLQFALKYNGPRAKSRGYHTRMASAYARYKSDD
jgi:hypothetical protein